MHIDLPLRNPEISIKLLPADLALELPRHWEGESRRAAARKQRSLRAVRCAGDAATGHERKEQAARKQRSLGAIPLRTVKVSADVKLARVSPPMQVSKRDEQAARKQRCRMHFVTRNISLSQV